MILTSSGFYGNVKAQRQVRFGRRADAVLPRCPGRAAELDHRRRQPVGHGRQEAGGVQGRRQVLRFPVRRRPQARLHQESGYLPITKAAYEKTKASGFYQKNPSLARSPMIELTSKEPTENSRGLRLGNMVQMRDIWAGGDRGGARRQKTRARQALDSAVPRGNAVLRQFERQAAR